MNLSSLTETRIAGESLFNDGIGVVIFLTLLKVKSLGVENVTPEFVTTLFATEVFGGVLPVSYTHLTLPTKRIV